MTRKRGHFLGMLAILAAAPGCVCCNHKSYAVARDAGPECPTPLAERQHTYLFMVNGAVPSISTGLDGLRDELARQGFSKVGCAQLVNVPWIAGEIRRIHADDPAARFVLLGYDVGGPAAAWLANDLAGAGISIDALVLLDPVGKSNVSGPVRTLLVTSGSKTATLPTAESMAITECGHFTLPTHPKTVAVVAELLASVGGLSREGEVAAPVIESTYEHAPLKGPASVPAADSPPAWNFLHDAPGNQTEPLAPIAGSIRVPSTGSQSLAPGLHSSQVARPR